MSVLEAGGAETGSVDGARDETHVFTAEELERVLRGAGCEEGGDARIVGGEVMDDVGDAVGGDEPGREGGEGCGGLLDGGERGG